MDEGDLGDDVLGLEEGVSWLHEDAGIVGGEAGMSWSAWEVGTVFALGGWLLDHHAVMVGQQIEEALAQAGKGRSGRPELRTAPIPAPRRHDSYDPTLPALEVGEPLDPARLLRDLALASAPGLSLTVRAEGPGGPGVHLSLVITVLEGEGSGPSMWIVTELIPDGVHRSQLVPVFQVDSSGTMAMFATDFAAEITDAVRWVCERAAVAPDELTVIERTMRVPEL